MNLETAIKRYDFILAEASVIETLRRSGKVNLHPRLEHALLVYNASGKKILSGLQRNYISIAHSQQVPIAICTPTWRANQERISESGIRKDVNRDAVEYLLDLKAQWNAWADNIMIGGLIGCQNDCYQPQQGLSIEAALRFHSWQIERLAAPGVDFLLAATLPAVPEATGITLALQRTQLPYIISFVINRNGYILDGTSLEQAFKMIDAAASRPPAGYMINCSYPSFLKMEAQPKIVRQRLIGFQANSSSLDHSELEGADSLHVDDIVEWGKRMIELNRKFGIKILGGCCGTGPEHLQYIARHIKGG